MAAVIAPPPGALPTPPPPPPPPVSTGAREGWLAQGSPSVHRSPRAAVRDFLTGTPGRLRLLAALAIAGCILFAVLGAIGLNRRAGALTHARVDSAQLVRLQDIRTSLVEADAAATNAFLVGGLEPSAIRAVYQDRLQHASSQITVAATHDRSDADRLGVVNKDLATYSGLIESARANNRQGFPLGTAYLRQASALLRDQILPALTDLSVTNQQRVRSAYDQDRSVTLLWLGGLIGLGTLVAAQLWIVERMRRLLNRPLLIATGVLAAALVGAAAAAANALSRADEVRAGPYRAAVALTAARSDAFDAKSAESLTLIARGSGQPYEQRHAQLMADATSKLDRTVAGVDFAAMQRQLIPYRVVHDKIRELDDAGDWDGAVTLATRSDSDGANSRFAAFADATGKALDEQVALVDDGLSEARAPIVVVQWLVLVAGLIAAVAAWRGIADRLREYR
jgi:hypothetical protein